MQAEYAIGRSERGGFTCTCGVMPDVCTQIRRRSEMKDPQKSSPGWIGFITLAIIVVSVCSLFIAIQAGSDRDYVGAGLCLLGANLGLGLLLNAIWRR